MKQYATIIGIALVIGLVVWMVTAEVAKAPAEPAPTGVTATTTVATTTKGGGGGGGIVPFNSGVQGTISLGPTCPVMRNPPDPQCADRPYATAITVYRAGSSATFATGKSDANGTFKISLPPGSYTLSAAGGKMLPRCSPVDVTVAATGYATANISCDTGIR